MGKFLSLVALVFWITCVPTRADEIVDVSAPVGNILGTLNISMQLDVTTLTVVASSAFFTSGSFVGTQLLLAPACTSNLGTDAICSVFTSRTDALFNFESNLVNPNAGFLVQLGDDDYTGEIFPRFAFPNVGTYPSQFVSDGPGFSYFPEENGTVIVTGVSEPSALPLLALGLLVLVLSAHRISPR
jgi:hypothetical protein